MFYVPNEYRIHNGPNQPESLLAYREGLLIPLTQGYVALIDDEDFPLIASYKWAATIRPHGVYAFTHEKGNRKGRKNVYLHRLIMSAPPDMEVDHIHETLDNRRKNLRLATRAQNAQNQKGRVLGQPRGVTWHHVGAKPWAARATLGGIQHHIGFYATKEEAGEAARTWRLEHMPFTIED